MPPGVSWGNVVIVGAASLVLAAIVAWGPAVPAPAPVPAATPAPVADSPVPSPPPAPPTPPAAPVPSTPPPAPARAPAFLPPLIAKGPLDARARPALIATPSRAKRERPPLYKQWLFWVVSGGLLASTVAVTIIVIRPRPQPYTGDLPPYVISYP
jgi:hypothetical protein